MPIKPYLFFSGRADEAIAFYQNALGAEVNFLLRFDESPEPPPPGALAPDWGKKIMHSCLRIGDSEVFLSDGCGTGPAGFNGFGVSLEAKSVAEAERMFGALADGGEARMPLGETFFAVTFGMAVDRFGVLWMIIVPK
ncbi:VOC family protein [Methylosinus sporium]|uniref:VOC family protein n=1 Tax=Methylosinus sporium TaxID=428 RepID=A0A2U1SV49_METSR|nr:VOC family protein [Methylosinus sporium]PWB95476.1 VOC family protein [Methylosinus sporium]